MKLISNAIDRRKVWKELPNYPLYSPPFHDSVNVLAKREIAANYNYFLEQKIARVEYLTKYLASFSLILRFDRESIDALDGWLYRFGGHLLPKKSQPKEGSVVTAMNEHEPEWAGVFRGLNVINDVAIFVGDYIIFKDPAVRWDIYYGNGTRRDYEEIGFGKPCLFGLRHLPKNEHYPILGLAEIFDCCEAGWRRLRGGPDIIWCRGELVRRIENLTSDALII